MNTATSTRKVRDFIVSVTTSDGPIGKARMLADAEGNAAIFVPTSEAPILTFSVDSPTSLRQLNGEGELDDGSTIKWQRTSAGCGWRMAKCKVSTQVLKARWDDFLMAGEPIESA